MFEYYNYDLTFQYVSNVRILLFREKWRCACNLSPKYIYVLHCNSSYVRMVKSYKYSGVSKVRMLQLRFNVQICFECSNITIFNLFSNKMVVCSDVRILLFGVLWSTVTLFLIITTTDLTFESTCTNGQTI